MIATDIGQIAANEAREYAETFGVSEKVILRAATLFYTGKSPLQVEQKFRDSPHHVVVCDYLLRRHPGQDRDSKQLETKKWFYSLSREERDAFAVKALEAYAAWRNGLMKKVSA